MTKFDCVVQAEPPAAPVNASATQQQSHTGKLSDPSDRSDGEHVSSASAVQGQPYTDEAAASAKLEELLSTQTAEVGVPTPCPCSR